MNPVLETIPQIITQFCLYHAFSTMSSRSKCLKKSFTSFCTNWCTLHIYFCQCFHCFHSFLLSQGDTEPLSLLHFSEANAYSFNDIYWVSTSQDIKRQLWIGQKSLYRSQPLGNRNSGWPFWKGNIWVEKPEWWEVSDESLREGAFQAERKSSTNSQRWEWTGCVWERTIKKFGQGENVYG